jgi:hypothetical protein
LSLTLRVDYAARSLTTRVKFCAEAKNGRCDAGGRGEAGGPMTSTARRSNDCGL